MSLLSYVVFFVPFIPEGASVVSLCLYVYIYFFLANKQTETETET